MSGERSVSAWIEELQAGNMEAAEQIWQRYYHDLTRMALHRLRATPRRVSDEEDAVVSAFQSFCEGARNGRFPQLRDRNDLWRLLVTMTQRKASDHAKHAHRQKRGGGKVRGESAFDRPRTMDQARGIEQLPAPELDPGFAAQVAESLQELLDRLDEESLRRIAILKLEGFTNEEIALKLDRTERTVERKLNRIRTLWSAESIE